MLRLCHHSIKRVECSEQQAIRPCCPQQEKVACIDPVGSKHRFVRALTFGEIEIAIFFFCEQSLQRTQLQHRAGRIFGELRIVAEMRIYQRRAFNWQIKICNRSPSNTQQKSSEPILRSNFQRSLVRCIIFGQSRIEQPSLIGESRYWNCCRKETFDPGSSAKLLDVERAARQFLHFTALAIESGASFTRETCHIAGETPSHVDIMSTIVCISFLIPSISDIKDICFSLSDLLNIV